MSIKIHHGANGSYKTSGALQDDAIPALKEGRTIITNIRGFTLERVHQVLPECPETVDVINLSMESSDDLDRMRRWFQWAPRGAFLIFDETQILFPKSWREKDLDQFDFPGGLEAAKQADRPTGWLDAWTRHRHWNWDVVLTTPNIRYIRDDIRLTCEKAYLHSNLAVIGIPGRYKEAMHDAQENRPAMDGSTIVEIKKIKSETFELYDSTATGKVQDTKAGKSLFLSPKLLGVVALIAGAVWFASTREVGGYVASALPGQDGQPVSSSAASPSGPRPGPSAPVAPGPVVPRSTVAPGPLAHPFASYVIQVRAALSGHRDGVYREVVLFELVDSAGKLFVQTAEDFRQLGYLVRTRTPCYVELTHSSGWKGVAFCPGSDPVASSGPGRPAGRSSGSVQSEGGQRGGSAPASTSL